MADSIHQILFERVLARFNTNITTANGYNFNMAGKVFEWRDTDYDLSELPAGNLMDVSQKPTDQQASNVQHKEFKLKLVLTVANAALTPKDVRKLIADFEKCIGEDRLWGTIGSPAVPLALNTKDFQWEMDVVQDKKIIGQVEILFTIQYRTRNFDPYTRG